VFSKRSVQLRSATTELLGDGFSVRSVPKLYNEDQLRLPESLQMAVRIVCWCEIAGSLQGREHGSRGHRWDLSPGTAGEDTADWEDLVSAALNCWCVWISDSAIVSCSYDLHEFSKSNYQSTPRLQSLNHVTTLILSEERRQAAMKWCQFVCPS
jgi:hypothetical protein